MSGAALMLWIAGVHLLGLGCVALLMFPALKDNPVGPDRRPEDGEDGWGRGPKLPPTPPAPPRGGIPLPDATPARVRLREHGRLSEQLPRRERRPAREPARRPVRTPHRGARSDWGRSRRSRSAG
ncbi:MAG TPA: hypothetical protein VHX62_17975 [Solirubrobacteraceae bacterium]|jgi:hypothetical protein|nr:hypothetical protein [Solirubrobacteraceae bacterium]